MNERLPQWAESIGPWFVSHGINLIVIIVTAFVIRWLLVRVINRVTNRMIKRSENVRLGDINRDANTMDLSGILMSQRQRQRAAAMGSLLRSIVTLTVTGLALMLVLSEFSIDLAPLLASAGIAGVALGFGAQSLVKDYLSGVLIIIEDQYGVGDIVDLGSAIGTVEDVSLRITRLRDLSGVVWYVRNGEILRVANKSQGWTLAFVDVPVSYDVDLERVRRAVEVVAERMEANPSLTGLLLTPPKYRGVESMSGDAVMVRINAKASPDAERTVTRELREQVKIAFDEAGIHVPKLNRGIPGTPGNPAAGPTQPGTGTPPR